MQKDLKVQSFSGKGEKGRGCWGGGEGDSIGGRGGLLVRGTREGGMGEVTDGDPRGRGEVAGGVGGGLKDKHRNSELSVSSF
jgi:hypothetical protein